MCRTKTFLVLLFVAAASVKAQFMFGPGFPFGPGGGPGGSMFPSGVLGPGFFNAMQSLHSNMNNMMTNFNKQMQEMQLQTSVLSILSSMLRGEGGTSIVSYNGKQVLVSNGASTLCTGGVSIQNNRVICDGQQLTAPVDICQPGKSMIRSNGRICLFESGNGANTISVNNGITIINGHEVTQCENGELFTEKSLQDRCGGNVLLDSYATVTYVPDPSQPNFIPFPNRNPYVGCEDPKAKVCKYQIGISGMRGFGGTQFNNIVIQS